MKGLGAAGLEMVVGWTGLVKVMWCSALLSLVKGFVHMVVSPWLQTNVETRIGNKLSCEITSCTVGLIMTNHFHNSWKGVLEDAQETNAILISYWVSRDSALVSCPSNTNVTSWNYSILSRSPS
jgi:hypothetical protein